MTSVESSLSNVQSDASLTEVILIVALALIGVGVFGILLVCLMTRPETNPPIHPVEVEEFPSKQTLVHPEDPTRLEHKLNQGLQMEANIEEKPEFRQSIVVEEVSSSIAIRDSPGQ